MINHADIENIIGCKTLVTNQMQRAIEDWYDAAINGLPLDKNPETLTLDLPALICAELARLTTLELEAGLTQAEICEQIGVPVRTFRRWCTQDPRIKQALSVGAEAALASVENALFKKAQSGDLGAMCFFLKNRDPEHWSEHPELRGYDGKVVFVDDIPKTAAPKPAEAAAETKQPDHP